MITDTDIKKFKKELKGELSIFVTRDEFNKTSDEIIDSIKTVINMVGEVSEKLDDHRKETNDILDDHERRLDKVEDKVFSLT